MEKSSVEKKQGPLLLSQVAADPEGKAVPFVTIEEQTGRFEVSAEAMLLLEGLPRDKKLAVVAIAGPYRTGKSFLANRLLGQSRGFEVGSTTQACTKGIWLWNRPVPLGEDTVMLLIDTEGLASTERSTNLDLKIFSLAILLSSLFVYNQMGPITEGSLEELALVANLTSFIQIAPGGSGPQQDFKAYFPAFFWVLRDFYHDLEGRSPKEYLEECLRENPRFSSDALRKNKIRGAVAACFRERDCFTLVRPLADEAKLAHVEAAPWDSLKPEFRRQLTHLVNAVGKRLRPKAVQGKLLTGRMFLQLALEYAEALNGKEAPVVLTALERVLHTEALKIADEHLDRLRAALEQALSEDLLPMSGREFNRAVKRALREQQLALQRQMAGILNFQEILEESQKFRERVKDLVLQKRQQNYSASYHFSRGLMENLQKTLLKGDAEVLPAPHEYLRSLSQLLKEYREGSTQSFLQWEVLADSLVALPLEESPLRLELVRPLDGGAGGSPGAEAGASLDEVDSYQEAAGASPVPRLPPLAEVVAQYLGRLAEELSEQLTRLRVELAERQQAERRLGAAKKQTEAAVEAQRAQNEELQALKHELELRIEQIRDRDLEARRQENEAVQLLKEAELKNAKIVMDSQSRQAREEKEALETQKKTLEAQLGELSGKVAALETEKRKEVTQVQHEIKKLEEDIEGLNLKIKSKANNPYFAQVNQFFSEVRELYLEEYRKLCEQAAAGSRGHKKELFALQRRLADAEYQASQAELALKRELDERMRAHREGLQSAFEKRQAEVEAERLRLQQTCERRAAYEQQLSQSIGLLQDAKERQMALLESRETHRRQVLAVREAKLAELSREEQRMRQDQMRMEDKIYLLSIENKQHQDDKEVVLMLLPHIHKALNGKPHNLKQYLLQIENDGLKGRVHKILAAYKVPGLK